MHWIGAVSILLCAFISVSSSDTGQNAASVQKTENHRKSRAVHEIFLSDPLDCLSQVVCGLNTFPPQVPTPRTSSANDYAYLLEHVVLRLKKQKVTPTTSATTTTTTASPVHVQQDEDDNSSEEQDDNEDQRDDGESDEEVEASAEIRRKELLKNSKDQNGDVVEMKKIYPPLGTIDFYRQGRAIKDNSKMILQKFRKDKKETKNTKTKKSQAPRIPTTQSPLQLLRRQHDIREKLRSNARCLYGILDHTCPFKYSELLLLMSAVLERQKVISYSTNTILPMTGYLLKSRSLTQTMKATFFALERINNITLTNQANQEPPTFSNVYDEIVRGEFPGNGLHIVETRIDAPASTHAWEDDEFDAALKNPFLPRDQIPGYAIKDRNKNKKKVPEENVENSAEDNQHEDGELILPPNAGPFTIADFVSRPEEHSAEFYDQNESSEDGGESPEDIPLPAVYGTKYDNTPKTRRRRRN